MRKIVAIIVIIVSLSSPLHAEEPYDPQHTMLALNMAIVSIHRIITAQDRIVLDQEYNTIINKLALGNIESDYEMTGLFAELMNFITGKGLRQEEAKRFQERYNRREQRQIVDALSGIRAYGGNLWSWLGSLATSCVSSYFSYQSSKAELLEGLNDDLWQLKKEEIEDCNELQVKLLNSSWNLLRQYKLPDEYRLTQESLNGYYKAVNESDPSKRLRMLRARNVERNFQVYPPYWYYRAKAAQESGNDSEALSCWDKFAEVWRPVLRNDPYKLEEAKYRVQRLATNSEANREEIRRLLGVIQDNISAGDWSNNLFAGVAYFLLGDKDEGIACVEVNVDFGYEETVSKTILAEMKKGELDAFTLFALQRDIEAAIEKPQTKQAEVKQPEKAQQMKIDDLEVKRLIDDAEDKEVAAAFVDWLNEDENGTEAIRAFERMGLTSKNTLVYDVLMFTERCSTPSTLVDTKIEALEKKWRDASEPKEAARIMDYYVGKGNRRAKFFWGWALWRYGNYNIFNDRWQKAIDFLLPFAEEGHFLAEYALGVCYYKKKDYANAMKYLLSSAKQGYAPAFVDVGGLYYRGYGVPIDYKKAYAWVYASTLFEKTAEDDVWRVPIYMNKINGKGVIWDSEPLISLSDLEEARKEGRRMYEETKKRNGWE